MTMVSNLWVQANCCNGSLPCSLSMDQQECAVMDPPEPPRARTAAVWQSPDRGPGTCQNTEPRRNCSDWIWEVRSHFNRKWARCHAIICDSGICANLNVDIQSTIVDECIFQSVHFVKQLRKGCRPVSVLPATKPTPGDRLAGHKSCQISWNHRVKSWICTSIFRQNWIASILRPKPDIQTVFGPSPAPLLTGFHRRPLRRHCGPQAMLYQITLAAAGHIQVAWKFVCSGLSYSCSSLSSSTSSSVFFPIRR